MNTANLLATLFLFLTFRNSICFENLVYQDYENLARNYAKWMQKSLTPDMFAYRGRGLLPVNTEPEYVNDSVQYANGPYDFILGNLQSQCTLDLLYVMNSTGSFWATQMIDSCGKPASGILGGNLRWAGDYTECKNVYAPQEPNSSIGNFHGRYCAAALKIDSSVQGIPLQLPLTVGLCVPDNCDGPQIKSDIQNLLYIAGMLPYFNNSNLSSALTDVTCKPLTVELDRPAIGMICLLSLFGFLMAAGSSITIFEYFVPSKKKAFLQPGNHSSIQNNAENAASNDAGINNVTATGESIFIEPSQNGTDEKKSLVDSCLEETSVRIVTGYVKPFLKTFCIFTNGAKILNTDVGEGQLLCIHGIRFLSMAWVILGHTYAFAGLSGTVGNPIETLGSIDTWQFQIILQGTLSVDSFFVLSGFLLTYLFLKEADKNDGKIAWPLFYIHRYWRLTPVYMIAVGFDTALTKYMSSGPFWSEGGFEVACRENWWRNLLYINNFGDPANQCFGWSWYLANDMQFYVISPIFLYALWRWPKVGLSIILTLVLSSWITSAVITVHYNMIATYGGITTANNQGTMDEMGDFFWKMYVKPYTRISPYLIGVLVGYLLYKTGNKKKFLEPWYQMIGWAVATALPLCVIFAVYDAKFTTSSAAAYNALGRSAFALGLAWVIYACQTGHGDIVNRILSWKMFIPLSRLTYCAYLVHPIVIIAFYQSLQQAIYFSHSIAVMLFFGFLVMSYMVALITSLTLESPMMGIEKLLLKKR